MSEGRSDHHEASVVQVKRTQTNPNGFYNDELTKQTLDLKEGFDCLYDDSNAGEASFLAPNQWPEGQVGQ
jgi:hypothetical protein